MPVPTLLSSPHVRSGLYSLVFAPVALVLMGSSMADVQAQAAVGQPLASVEGLIGMALASILFALISLNCDRSPAGMIVMAAVSIPIGALQTSGFLTVPLLQSFFFDPADMMAAVGWSLYPFAVTLILSGSAGAFVAVHRGINAAATMRPILQSHRHAWVTTVSIPTAMVVVLLIFSAAPSDTSGVATYGMAAVADPEPEHLVAPMFCALLLAFIALLSSFSLTGPQVSAWAILVIPAYVLEPLWASLTGNIVAPGESFTTRIALSAPVITAFGLILGTTTLGVHTARTTVLKAVAADRDDEDGTAPGFDAPAEDPADSPPSGACADDEPASSD